MILNIRKKEKQILNKNIKFDFFCIRNLMLCCNYHFLPGIKYKGSFQVCPPKFILNCRLNGFNPLKI